MLYFIHGSRNNRISIYKIQNGKRRNSNYDNSWYTRHIHLEKIKLNNSHYTDGKRKLKIDISD